MSHYIPYFTRENGARRETVCYAWVLPGEHSNEPTCQVCRDWLQQDAIAEMEDAESFSYEFKDGLLLPKETHR